MEKIQTKQHAVTPKAKGSGCGCGNGARPQEESKSKAKEEPAEQPLGVGEKSCCGG